MSRMKRLYGLVETLREGAMKGEVTISPTDARDLAEMLEWAASMGAPRVVGSALPERTYGDAPPVPMYGGDTPAWITADDIEGLTDDTRSVIDTLRRTYVTPDALMARSEVRRLRMDSDMLHRAANPPPRPTEDEAEAFDEWIDGKLGRYRTRPADTPRNDSKKTGQDVLGSESNVHPIDKSRTGWGRGR